MKALTEKQITIVIPTYNESENLADLITALLQQNIRGLKILVVDDNSPDGTGEIADGLMSEHPEQVFVLHRESKQGLGRAYLHGFRVALEQGAEAVGQMDADFSHPPEKWPEFADALNQYDLVIGSRYVPGGSVDHSWPLWRRGLSAFGNYYARWILGLPFKDATGGFRLFRRELLLSMPLNRVRSNGYVYQVEMGYLAYLCGANIGEVPFYFADRSRGTSKMSLRIQIEAARRVWQVWWNYRDLAQAFTAVKHRQHKL